MHNNIIISEFSNHLRSLNGVKDSHHAKVTGGEYIERAILANYKAVVNSSVYIALVPLSNHRIYVAYLSKMKTSLLNASLSAQIVTLID